jgi:transcription elongation factor Elf1
VPEIGRPYDPEDPNEERTFTTMMKAADLAPFVDTSGGVQIADREGVFAHSFRCRRCTLHFVLISWLSTRHTPGTIRCPECGNAGRFLHRINQLSTSKMFSLALDRQPEIYDLWPFRLRARDDIT